MRVWRVAVIAAWTLREIARTAWGLARGPVVLVLQLFAALFVLFEEWGWKPLSAAIARLARYAPIAKLEAWIASLGPYPALLVFALPTSLLLPLKFVAMWLLAQGQVVLATGLFIGAKIVSTALIARIFTLTQPSLMRIAWFARAYNWFVPWKDALFAVIRNSWLWRYGRVVKTATTLRLKAVWARVKPSVLPYAERAANYGRGAVNWLKTLWNGSGAAPR